ncbi:MAG TPA: RodZ domain-containing protein [Gaiellaceae bacterium]|nr:RodZ domain-containing protein [Gaiellaceae bacterium]
MFDIGSSLRDARLRQGLDFPELEQRTKIRPKYLRALEEERFDILPAPTYVRGFLRSYASALGLDPQPFVDEYNSRFAVGEEDVGFRSRPAAPRRRGRARRESGMALAALAAIAVVTALVIAAWRFGGPERQTVPGLAPQGAPAGVRPQAPAGPVRLVVRAVAGDSWMEVRSGGAAGRILYSGTLERGQRKAFSGRRLQLALAEPENVAVRLNGKPRRLPAGTTFVVTARRIVPAS